MRGGSGAGSKHDDRMRQKACGDHGGTDSGRDDNFSPGNGCA